MTTLECTCGIRFANTVDLQYHNISCNQQNRRRSSRNKKQTPKEEAYNQMLQSEKEETNTESDSISTDESKKVVEEVKDEDKMKYVETSMKQLTLEDEVSGVQLNENESVIGNEEAVSDKSINKPPIPLEVATPSTVPRDVEMEDGN